MRAKVKTTVDLIKAHLEANGSKVSWLSKKAKISNTHLHFVLKKERPLSEEHRNSINKILKTNY
jgi:lambda repressor-like predicted transcriptional regulator